MKKVMSAVLAVTIIFSIFTIVPASATDTESNAVYGNDVQIIVDLGLLELSNNGEIDVNAEVTRRDLSEMVVKSMGLANSVDPVDTIYSDVKSDDHKSGYINVAGNSGIMIGYSDGTFEPFGAVTYNEAVKTLVCMVGHGEYAEAHGGYPLGYLKTALTLDIIDRSNPQEDHNITLGELCYMLKKALEADYLMESSYKDSNIGYTTAKGMTLLSEKLDIYKLTGQVTATYFTSLAGQSNLRKDQIAIEDIVYKSDLKELYKLLGMQLVFYIKRDNGFDGEKVVAIDYRNNYNKQVKFNSKDIETISGNKIKYYTDGASFNATVADDAYLIYNGKAKLSWSFSDLVNVEYTLLDSEGDGIFDVVFANKYVNLAVETTNVDENTIWFKTDSDEWSKIKLDEDKGTKFIITDKDDIEVDIRNLQEWDILSVAKSLDGEVYIIKFSNEYTEGFCSEIAGESAIIEGKEYEYDKNITLNPAVGPIKIGVVGKFYFDFRGKIIAVDYTGDASKKYGYLVDMAGPKGLDDTIKVRLFTENGEFVNFTLANKVKLNKVITNSTALVSNDALVSMSEVKKQLIAYETNVEGKINSIETALDGNLYTEDERIHHFTKSDTFPTIYYRGGNMKIIASRYFVGEETKIFIIPANVNDESSFMVCGVANLISSKQYSNVNIYDVTQNNVVGALTVAYAADMFIQNSSPLGIVTGVAQGLNDDGDTTTVITVNTDGVEKKLTPKNEDVQAIFGTGAITDLTQEKTGFADGDGKPVNAVPLDKIEVGDVVMYAASTKDEIDSISILFRNKSKKYKEAGASFTKDNAYSGKYYTFSSVDKVLPNGLRFQVPVSGSETEKYTRVFPYYSGTKYLRCIPERGVVNVITQNDIEKGDNVFLFASGSNVKLVVVYE
ncbi:MAG: S-layer homology domain-containing protein [Clostridia bacterium]|nr:S-layer homology domain-containing protein [Clostridia bacterium]